MGTKRSAGDDYAARLRATQFGDRAALRQRGLPQVERVDLESFALVCAGDRVAAPGILCGSIGQLRAAERRSDGCLDRRDRGRAQLSAWRVRIPWPSSAFD